MTENLAELESTFRAYLDVIGNPALDSSIRSTDLRHMRFWYPYYANVVSALSEGKTPTIEKRTLKEVNAQSQLDYATMSDRRITHDLRQAHEIIVENILKLPTDIEIPYKSRTKFTKSRYIDVLIDHWKTHIKYLSNHLEA